MEKKSTLDLKQIALGNTEKLVMMPCSQDDTEGHDHRFFELVYVTSGTCVHTLNDVSSDLKAGDYFFVDYGSVHCYSQSRNLNLINCLFLPAIIDDTLHGCHSFDALIQGCLIRYYTPSLMQTPANRIFHDKDSRVLQLLTGMSEEYREKRPGYTEIFRCRLIEILILTLRGIVKSSVGTTKNKTVLDAVQFVDRNYREHITLGMFCQEHHFSLQYISRKFKQETGITFREYLQKVRIEKSCELLAGSDLRIWEIASSVGYDDIKFFNSMFKKLVMMSPREYRKLTLG